MTARGSIRINPDRCKGCAICVGFCPQNLIRMSSRINRLGYMPAAFIDKEERCTGCTLCALMCPDAAIEVYR